MEIIVDIAKAVYKERIVRCKDCRKKYACVTFEGIGNEDGFCSMGETEREHIISTWNEGERE